MNTFAINCQQIALRRHRLMILKACLPMFVAMVATYALGVMTCWLAMGGGK